MLKRSWIVSSVLLPLLLLAACAAPAAEEARQVTDQMIVEVYRSPTWGCCSDWVGYLKENGYAVNVHDVTDLGEVKTRYGVPLALQSCHTAVVDGYIVEGHVPVAEIERLLDERPAVVGVAVPGMPAGSPGMEVDGVADQPYDVLAFTADGQTTVFASYR